MKPKPKYIISICRSKNGQFFWRVRARNNEKVAATGEPNVNKAHVVKMAKSLFLAGFEECTFEAQSWPGLWWSHDAQEYRKLEDLTTNKTKKKK